MALSSMTGFARTQGRSGAWTWTWEIKTVNARGLDLRLRLPAGFDGIDSELRAAIAKRIDRGTCHATLSAARSDATPRVRVDRAVLDSLIAAIADIPTGKHIRRASLDGLLALRGVVEVVEPQDDEDEKIALQNDVRKGLVGALDALVAARRAEGDALHRILVDRIARIGMLAKMAEDAPGRSADAVRARLARQIEALGQTNGLDSGRLHQEAVLLAAKADIREELDRLITHVANVSGLLSKGGIVGRRLDFLAQELGRESNTLCAKSNDAGLTAIGLDLKIEVEQFREQVQNIE